MTIDTLIAMLEEAKGQLPSGGRARVIFCDELLVQAVHVVEGQDAVVISDYDEDGNELPLSQLRCLEDERGEEWKWGNPGDDED